MMFKLIYPQGQPTGTVCKTLSYLNIRGMVMVLSFAIILSSCERIQTMGTVGGETPQTTAFTITAGSPGGSFTPFATAISNIVMQHEPQLELTVEASPGSVENTRRVNDNPDYLGVAFRAESYLGYHGQEVFADEGAKTNIRGVTLLYIAYAQAIVLADSDIQYFTDLAGKKIANGQLGSGSAKTAERLAVSVGIWDEITPIYKSGNEGIDALLSGEADLFQWLVSVPNSAIQAFAETHDIKMLDLDISAQESGFYDQYPFYLSGRLPDNAYDGNVEPVNTLLMPTLLIAHKEIPAEIVYTILKRVYTQEGLQSMVSATAGAAADMTIENASKAFGIPLHQGACQFWLEQDVSIPEAAMPVD